MKVYNVTMAPGSEIVGTFSSLEKAREFVKKYVKKYPSSYSYIKITEVSLDEEYSSRCTFDIYERKNEDEDEEEEENEDEEEILDINIDLEQDKNEKVVVTNFVEKVSKTFYTYNCYGCKNLTDFLKMISEIPEDSKFLLLEYQCSGGGNFVSLGCRTKYFGINQDDDREVPYLSDFIKKVVNKINSLKSLEFLVIWTDMEDDAFCDELMNRYLRHLSNNSLKYIALSARGMDSSTFSKYSINNFGEGEGYFSEFPLIDKLYVAQ